jgi:hypothetical protein
MNTILIRDLVFRAPFRPFTLKMNDGRDFYIRHPELISVAITHVYLIDDRTNRGIFLEPALIASMQADEEKSSTGAQPNEEFS